MWISCLRRWLPITVQFEQQTACNNHIMFSVLYFREVVFIFRILQVLSLGQPGEEVTLELILRVVADVGLVVSALSCFLY